MTTRLRHVKTLNAGELILRCIHSGGDTQKAALRELDKRGLWLTQEQRQQAGLDTPNNLMERSL